MERVIQPHDPTWPAAFAAEADRIAARVGPHLSLAHIGSTAVPGLCAKPIIDMLGTVADLGAVDGMVDALCMLGYAAKGAHGIAGRRYFRRSVGGRRSHHLHVFETGAPEAWDHLATRDYLRAHPREAQAYAAAKAQAAMAGPKGYQAAKDGFVAGLVMRARDWAARRQIVSSHNDDTGLLCIDIRRDRSGYAWHACRCDPEDGHGWRETGAMGQGFASADAALDAAAAQFPWARP